MCVAHVVILDHRSMIGHRNTAIDAFHVISMSFSAAFMKEIRQEETKNSLVDTQNYRMP